ncbi:MAG: DUF2652 domain-containing protein [Anaerolineae bacterium]|nr:MAG: DUF2652 domain-containing protein [Anaerolineae bacterium]
MAHTGYMIVADISGYTAYLSTSELEHAQEILESLINTILKRIHPPIILSRTEGDAVFAYTLDESLLQGQTLLEAAEEIYCSFATELEHNKINTTCDCNACRNMSSLDLKIVIHHGTFGLQKLGNHTELIGSDVNLTHRLLKNHVIEKTGIMAYCFFSEAAIKAMGLEEFTAQMARHSETYDHLGEVQGFVYDLKGVYQRNLEKRRTIITPEMAEIVESAILPVPPAVLWDYLNEPQFRARYRFSESSRTSNQQDGRLGEGTIYHCVHGERTVNEKIIDWKPFEYITIEGTHTMSNVALVYHFTMTLTPFANDTQTKLEMLLTANRARNPLLAPLAARIWQKTLKPAFQMGVAGSFSYLKEAIQANTASVEASTS